MAVTVAELHEAVVARRGRTMLGPLSLAIGQGDFWGVLGPNGAGKSTLLRTLAGKQKVSTGRVSLFGDSSDSGASSGTALRLMRRTGMLLQSHEYIPDIPFTVRDVVLFGRAGYPGLGRRYRSEDHAAVDRALDHMELAAHRSRLYRELSGGEQRKVQLARILAQEPDLMLLDEPAAGLDIDWQERLTCLIGDIYKRFPMTVVMVTHDIDRLPACCNRALLLKQGSVLAEGTPSEVFTESILSALYGCPIEVAVRNGRYHGLCIGEDRQR